MPFLRIEFNFEALRKLAERGISVDDGDGGVRAAPVVWINNPNPRAEDSRWLIGPTGAGRFLTVVVDRDGVDHGRWHVMTGCDRCADPPLPKRDLTRHLEARHVRRP